MDELALFAGVGGGILGGILSGFRTVCAVEKEPYCREVLLRRQRDGVLPMFPIWDDVRTFDGKRWRGSVDIVTAGFPCQPFSVAGKQRAEDDDRNMWPETIRIIREVGPRYALLENVTGLLTVPYIRTIFGELAESGYDARWRILSAAELGAPHQRDRLWIVADTVKGRVATNAGIHRGNGAEHQENAREVVSSGPEMAQPENAFEGCPCVGRWWKKDPSEISDTEPWWKRGRTGNRLEWRRAGTREVEAGGKRGIVNGKPQPRLGRVVDGVAHRVDRLRAIGNGQVPAVARAAWELLR